MTMSQANTASSLVADFVSLGLRRDTIVMVHSSLSRIGWTQGGPATVATDGSTHFPIVGQQFADGGHVRSGKVGSAAALLFSTRALVDFAEGYFREALTCP
jgi:aminoglycoside N3'-acetyltransferase